jgi:beta-lactam-binding protein with PASTA domain
MDSDHTVTASFTMCKVPKLKGRSLRGAKRLIKKHYCSVGKVRRKYSSRFKKGRVISQKPRAGTKHPTGWKVRLTVSKGPRRSTA